jgi:hypothetical protein
VSDPVCIVFLQDLTTATGKRRVEDSDFDEQDTQTLQMNDDDSKPFPVCSFRPPALLWAFHFQPDSVLSNFFFLFFFAARAARISSR